MGEDEDWARYNGEGKWDQPIQYTEACEGLCVYGERLCANPAHFYEDGQWWCWQHRPSRWAKEVKT